AGGVSSTVRDLARWMRLQLGGGRFEGKQVVAAAALEETHRPQIVSGFNPENGRPSFYGLGWNVNYDDRGRLRLGHSGAFELGAATTVMLVPAEQIGIAVLTNAAPIGLPEGLAATFLDLALEGRTERDWIALYKRAFDDARAAERAGILDTS